MLYYELAHAHWTFLLNNPQITFLQKDTVGLGWSFFCDIMRVPAF